MGHTITTKFQIGDEVSCKGSEEKQTVDGVQVTLFRSDKIEVRYSMDVMLLWHKEEWLTPWIEPVICCICHGESSGNVNVADWAMLVRNTFYLVCKVCRKKQQPENIENEFERRLFGEQE